MTHKGLFIFDYVNNYFEDSVIDKWKEISNVEPTTFLDLDLREIEKYIYDNNINFMQLPYSSKINYTKFKDFEIPVILGLGDAPRRLHNDDVRNIVIENRLWGITLHTYSPVECIRDYLYPYEINIFPYKWGLDFSIFDDYNLQKDIDVSSTGKYSNYQMRRELDQVLVNKEYIKFVRNRKPYITRENQIDYAKFLNRSLFSIGGCMQEKVLTHYKGKFISDNFPKNLEIPAVNTCLITTEWGDREILGFRNEKNCIIIKSPRDALRKIIYYKENPTELRRLSKNGYDLVHKNHNIDVTTKELIMNIERKLNE